MKRITIAFSALITLLAISCQKEEITPSKPYPKNKVINCRTCEGHWDLTDTISK